MKTLKVCKQQCNECLFSKSRIVSEERAKEIIAQCLESDKWFICHKSTLQGGDTCCKGFYDKHKGDVFPLRLAQVLGLVEEVDVENEK